MPVSIETTANALTDLDLFTEISYGTVTPNFDKLDVYVDATQLRASKMIWRLYATTSGLRSPIAVVGPIASDFPMRIIAGLGMISATTYELTGELVDSIVYPVLPPVAPVVIAGLAGYDSLINSAPLTSASSHKLIYGGSVTFGTIGAYYPKFQVELDLTGAGPKCSSNWILYAIVTGAGGTITAPVAQQSYNYTSEQPAKLIILQASSIGASSYRLVGVGQDPTLTIATPAVSAALTGFSETVDGTGGGGITQLTQDVLAGPGAGSVPSTVDQVSRNGLLIRKSFANANDAAQSLWQVSQPSQFVAAEVYGGGAAFDCDTGPLATTLIECAFAGGGAGTINLPSNNAGRVLHIADQSSTITVLATLTLQPDAAASIGGGAVGAPLVITTTGWAQKLVLNSAGNNWMIF